MEIKGVSSRSEVLGRLLAKWIKTNVELAEAWKGEDLPWWYNERASLSVLAGAVWRLGGVAFEEFTARKGEGRRTKTGRADMYFQLGKREFLVEAKIAWPGLGAGGAGLESSRIAKRWHSALSEARQPFGTTERSLAMLFISPTFPEETEPPSISSRLREFAEELEAFDSTASAWVFPEEFRNIEVNGRIFPGTAVVVQDTGRARQR